MHGATRGGSELENVAERLKGEIQRDLAVPQPPPSLLILDGFLLLAPALAALHPLFDIKILLRASYAAAKARREARSGYVTLEGFWQDPPGYFDAVVWPGYVEGHQGFFEGGDVEGKVREDVCREMEVEVQPTQMGESGLGEVLEWVVGVVRKGVSM